MNTANLSISDLELGNIPIVNKNVFLEFTVTFFSIKLEKTTESILLDLTKILFSDTKSEMSEWYVTDFGDWKGLKLNRLQLQGIFRDKKI